MDPSPCNSVSSIQSGDDYTYFGKKDMISNDEKKEDTKPYVKSSTGISNATPYSKNMSTEKNSSMKNMSFANASSSGTSGCTKEEDITKDDLQAMKDMIGDIRKDPSLLYRLSSLATGVGSSAFNVPLGLGGNVGNYGFLQSNALHLNNTVRSSIEVDDDHTEVSSLGMMSYDDHNSGRYHKPVNQFGNLGKLDQSASQQQFGSPTQELTASRTNRDVEIALRMQSLRAKKGLFNASQASNIQRRSSQQPHQKTGDTRPRLNTAPSQLGQLGNAKLSGSALTPRDKELKLDATKDTDSLKDLGAASKKDGDATHRSISAPRNEHFQRKTEERGLRKAHTSIEQHPLPQSEQSCRTPESAKEKQQVEIPNAPKDLNGGGSQVVTNEEHAKKDDDSENSALVVFKEVQPSDITPHHENRRTFGNALALSGSEGYTNYTLPFKPRDATKVENHYHSAVSKHTNSSCPAEHDSDEKLDQFKRSSSSRSATRRQTNDTIQRQRSDSIRSKSARQVDESERMQPQTDRSKLEQQMDDKAAKKLAKSKRPEGSQRRRSQSETRRSEEQHSRSSKHDTSMSQSERKDGISYQPKRGTKSNRVVMQDAENHHQHDRNTHAPKENDDGEENVDKVTSLPALNFDASYFSLGDFVMPVPEGQGLGEQLRRLNLRDGHYHDQESQSGRSVISRISHLVKAAKRGSESNCSHPSSLQELHSSSSNGNISPKKSIESDADDGSLTQRTGRKLIARLSYSRLSHLGGGLCSPQLSHRRRTTAVENLNTSLTYSDWEKCSIRSASAGDAISHGFSGNVAFDIIRSSRDELAGHCDEKGRCIFHPHIR